MTHPLELLLILPILLAAAPANDPFSPQTLHTLHLTLPPAAWQIMQPVRGDRGSVPKTPSTQPYTEGQRLPPGPAGLLFAYARANLDFDGQTLPNVGLRFKGNVSYNVSAATPRRPFKLDLNRFVKDQRLAGLTSLNLNNSAFDPSELRETLAFALFRELHVPAPRTSFAALYLTVPGLYQNEYLGRYTLVEEVDKHFLKQHFHNPDGLLCKPEGIRGLPYFGQDWSAYSRLYNPKSPDEHHLSGRIIALADLVNHADTPTFNREIPLLLDVDEFLRYIAVNAAIANIDSFLSTGHNFYLYVNPADGRISFIPWDMNLAFGGDSWVGNAEEQANLSIDHPWTDHNRLLERLLAIDAYNKAYRRYLQTLADLLSPEKIAQRLAQYQPTIDQASRAAVAAAKQNSPTTRPAAGLRLIAPDLFPFLAQRHESLRLQLAGQRQGFIASYTNPDQLPLHLGAAAPIAVALMKAIDTDGDTRLSDSEVSAAIDKLWLAAGIEKSKPLDRPAAAATIEKLLTPTLRSRAQASAWTNFLFLASGARKHPAVTQQEVFSGYHRHFDDRDNDTLMDMREAVEAIARIGPP